jgi:hypothetical protein
MAVRPRASLLVALVAAIILARVREEWPDIKSTLEFKVALGLFLVVTLGVAVMGFATSYFVIHTPAVSVPAVTSDIPFGAGQSEKPGK